MNTNLWIKFKQIIVWLTYCYPIYGDQLKSCPLKMKYEVTLNFATLVLHSAITYMQAIASEFSKLYSL